MRTAGDGVCARRRALLLWLLPAIVLVSFGLNGCAGVVGEPAPNTPPSNPSSAIVISNVLATPTASSAQITWTTNLAANSQVDYGTTTSYGTSTPINPTMATTHLATLAGLTKGTLYHFRIHSTDASGTTAFSRDATFTTIGEATPLSVSLTAPANGATVSGTVNVTATASGTAGITSVQFQVDGASIGAASTAAPYAYSWDTTKASNGTHTLDAVAKDSAGNSTTSAVVSVAVNNGSGRTFSISGTIGGAGGNGASVTLSGAGSATTTANASGAYTFSGLASGTYTVTPSHAGFTFSPGSQNATVSGANVTGINFTAAAQTFSISGTISGSGGNGATVTLSGASTATTTANASGAYTFSGLASGTYTVTPSHAGFTFNPASQNATIAQANVTGINFAATAQAAPKFSISGTIGGTGGNGASVTLSGAGSATTTANASGAYTFSGLASGTYTVTPSHAGFTFNPASQNATIAQANVTAINFAATAQAAPKFSISGTISPAAGGAGATVTLSGAANATTVANNAGAYSFTGLVNGTYTLTPSRSGFTFSPGSQNTTISGANVTGLNFTVVAQTFSISGTIGGAGGNGASVTLSGAGSATTTANASGAYTFSGLASGTYTVTPSHAGFTFSPGSQNATVSGANVTGINFTAAAQTFSISGTISGSGGNGATVTLSGASTATTTANASGAYTFSGLANGTYTVTPSHAGFTFSPGSQNATVSGASVSGLNFAAITPSGPIFSISGTIGGTGGNGASVTLSGAGSATTTANASGAYTFSGLASGTYTVTPSHAGFTFNPASQNATIAQANVTAINFAATAQAAPKFSISGTISPAAGGAGATVTLSGAANATTVANNAGAYSFTGLVNGTYTLTPSRSGFTFSPGSQNTTISGANVTGLNFTVVAQTFSISGTIGGAGGNGASVTLSGAGSATTTANASGAYTFSGLASGTYTVTPSHAGFTFSPGSQNATVSGANVTGINFTAAAQTFSISGTISGSGGNGATVTLSGGASTATTANASGAYTFSGLANGTYTVTPSHAGFTFNPASQNATIAQANVTGLNFAATAQAAPKFSISGTIGGAGGNGASVTLSGAGSATTTANASGAYTFSGLANGTYTVTPSDAGFTFSPGSQNATVLGANVTGINFTAAAQTFSISGTISGSGGNGATVTLSGVSTATTTANASGAYTFGGLANGTYTVTPSHAGFTFSQAAQSVKVTGASVTGVNFTATATVAHSVALSWAASTSAISGYNVYRSTTSGTGFVKLNSGLVKGLTYTDTGVQSGWTYFYVTTAVDSSGDESIDSNQTSATIP